MEDLEKELGAVPRVSTDYMHVRISYSHSAFPKSNPSRNKNIAIVTRLETIVTASIPRQDAKSPWAAARLLGVGAGRENPVVGIIKEHWSGDKSKAATEKVLFSVSGAVTRPPPIKQSMRPLPRRQGFATVGRNQGKQGLENLPMPSNAFPAGVASPAARRVSSKENSGVGVHQGGQVRVPS
jgi:hypothetical protein